MKDAADVLNERIAELEAEIEALMADAAHRLNTIQAAFTLLDAGMEMSAYRALKSAIDAAREGD